MCYDLSIIDDAGVQKLVDTLNRLVDAKDDALSEEINRRKEAEQKGKLQFLTDKI